MRDGPLDSGEQVAHPHDERGTLLAATSDRIVQLHKHFYGKGPTKAKAYLQGDLLVVLLRGGYSRVEQTLHDTGHRDAVIAQRAAYQEAVEGHFRAAIESLLGREVLAFMSTNHEDPDMMAELFV